MSISSVFNRNDKSKISRLRKKLGEWHLGCWGFTRISGCLSGWFAPVPTNSMLTDLNVNPNVNPVIHNTLCRLNMILVREEKFCVDLADYLLRTYYGLWKYYISAVCSCMIWMHSVSSAFCEKERILTRSSSHFCWVVPCSVELDFAVKGICQTNLWGQWLLSSWITKRNIYFWKLDIAKKNLNWNLRLQSCPLRKRAITQADNDSNSVLTLQKKIWILTNQSGKIFNSSNWTCFSVPSGHCWDILAGNLLLNGRWRPWLEHLRLLLRWTGKALKPVKQAKRHLGNLRDLKLGGDIVFTQYCIFFLKVAKKLLLQSLHSQPLVSLRIQYPPKILKNPEVLMLQYQGTFDQRQDGWHSSEYEV